MKPVSTQQKQDSSKLLIEILSDKTVLYQKARNYHWNVVGNNFFGLHSAFEKIYDELAEDIDVLAERVRVLGFKVPGTLKELLEISSLKEEPNVFPNQNTMVKNIIEDLEVIISQSNEAALKIQNDFKDDITAGILFSLIEKYEKTVWMLKSANE